jgi:hypothetical protein
MRLYKYMPPTTYTLEAIKTNKFYFSSLSELNDPFEFSCTVDGGNPAENRAQVMWVLAHFMRPPENGVFCLSEEWNHLLMWQHYAGGHYGIVVEFETDNDATFFNGLIEVTYKPKPPVIEDSSTVKDIIGVKHFDSHYEKEWRVFGYKGPKHIDPKAIISVTAGARLFYHPTNPDGPATEIVEHIMRAAMADGPTLYIAKLDRSSFSLTRDLWK